MEVIKCYYHFNNVISPAERKGLEKYKEKQLQGLLEPDLRKLSKQCKKDLKWFVSELIIPNQNLVNVWDSVFFEGTNEVDLTLNVVDDFAMESDEESSELSSEETTIQAEDDNDAEVLETLLDEDIEYDNQTLLQNSIFNQILFDKTISEEDSWIEGYSLLDDKKIKIRYLFSSMEDDLRLYRMDIKALNKDNDDNKVNNVILDNDIIMIWTNLKKEIKKISLRYNGATYVLKLNEE